MRCPRCGREINNESAFCPSCGPAFGYQPIEEISQPQADAAVKWYYISHGTQKGPVSDCQLSDLIKKGNIDRDTMVWREGFSRWQKIENTSLRYIVQSNVPTVPLNSLSDKWPWALATVPFLGYFILTFLQIENATFISFFIFYPIFLLLDELYLRKNRIVTKPWRWSFLIIPLYLFIRASKTTKNMAPGIVWCVLFVLSLFI